MLLGVFSVVIIVYCQFTYLVPPAPYVAIVFQPATDTKSERTVGCTENMSFSYGAGEAEAGIQR